MLVVSRLLDIFAFGLWPKSNIPLDLWCYFKWGNAARAELITYFNMTNFKTCFVHFLYSSKENEPKETTPFG